MKIPLSVLGLFLSLAFGNAQADTHVIYLEATETDDLKAKEGQKVTVHGETTGSGKSSSGTNFVNFKGAEFYLVTFKTDLNLFPDGEPTDVYDEKRLAVTGVVSVYQGKPQFKLTSPDQIRILSAEEEFPPKQKEPKPEPKPETKPEPAPVTEPKPEEETKPKPPVDPKDYFK